MSKLKVNKKSKVKYTCMDCNAPAAYFSIYDTFACMKCDIWLDPCGCKKEDNCPFWAVNQNRKDKPSLEDQNLILFCFWEKEKNDNAFKVFS